MVARIALSMSGVDGGRESDDERGAISFRSGCGVAVAVGCMVGRGVRVGCGVKIGSGVITTVGTARLVTQSVLFSIPCSFDTRRKETMSCPSDP
jgi:hypothetical protein